MGFLPGELGVETTGVRALVRLEVGLSLALEKRLKYAIKSTFRERAELTVNSEEKSNWL